MKRIIISAFLILGALSSAMPLLANNVRTTAFAVRAEIESLNNLATECYINQNYECSQLALLTIMGQPDNVEFLSSIGGQTVCQTLRNLDNSYVRLIEDTAPVTRLRLLLEYETLLKNIRGFDISKASIDCVQASQQSAGAFFLLERGWSCHLLGDGACATEAVLELRLANGVFTWNGVSERLDLEVIRLRQIYAELHKVYAWDAEMLQKKRAGKDYKLSFFYDHLQ